MTSSFDDWVVLHSNSNPSDALKSERFRFLANGHVVPGYFVPNPNFPDRLLVMLNGAVQREKGRDPREVFQRRSWANDFDANVLILADATLTPENNLRIGWSQGNGTSSLQNAMAQCVELISSALGVGDSSMLFFGSSAGGFQAVALHAYFRRSRFLVNNAQFDWTKYHVSAVKDALRRSFGSMSVQEVRQKFPERCNVFNRFLDDRIGISGTYLLNVASREDYKTQFPVLLEFLSQRAAKQPKVSMDVNVEYYADPRAGHMPRSRPFTVQRVNRMLSEMETNKL